MAIDAINAQVASLISNANIQAQEKINEGDRDDQVRKKAEKKVLEKKEAIQQTVTNRETFQRQNQVDQRMQQILGGGAGRDAADALNGWQNNQQLQSKLTDAQKNMFREAMANNPKAGTKSAEALNRLTQTPGFQNAVTNSQQMGTLQEGMVRQPQTEKPASDMLQGRFMQSKKADAQTKTDFLRFGLNQAAKGRMDSVRKAGDMLGSLAQTNTPRGAQRAAMRMVQRNPDNTKGMDNLDGFVKDPNVSRMPTFARGKATELLAKADGNSDVREGFEKLASDPKFRGQNASNQGRTFATIGTGRPSEFRAITDQTLTALQSNDFPNRSGQVSKFLGKLSSQIQRGGAAGIDTAAAMRQAKASTRPSAPRLQSTDDMDEEEASKVRSQNRAQVMQYFNKLQQSYDHHDKKRKAATAFEDVKALPVLHEPESLDLQALASGDAEFAQWAQGRLSELQQQRKQLLQSQNQRARELRTKRRPLAKRRAQLASVRARGRQPKYFSPAKAGGPSASQVFGQATGTGAPAGLPQSPMHARRAVPGAAPTGGGDIQQQVARAVSQLGSGPITAEKAGQVAQAIASQVASQVAAQVTAQLLGSGPAPASEAPHTAAPPAAPQGTAQTDGWGIPRTFDRDLTGPRAPVRTPGAQGDFDSSNAVDERYTGRRLVKDDSAIRSLADVWSSHWRDVSKPEQALLKNLGWNQQMWDTKDGPAGQLPRAMGTLFADLTPVQREAVRKMGLSPADWDSKAGEFAMVREGKSGKNA